MQNKNYEAVKAKYVDEMMLRIMELEASNEMLKEKISANSAAAPKTSGAPVSSPGMPANASSVSELKAKLDEANKKYRMVTNQYNTLKVAYNKEFSKKRGLRRVAQLYAAYGISGFFGILKNKIAQKRGGEQ